MRDCGVGLGAMYIGKEVLNPKDDFLLKGGAVGDRKVHIIWTKQVADFVLMLGMEIKKNAKIRIRKPVKRS